MQGQRLETSDSVLRKYGQHGRLDATYMTEGLVTIQTYSDVTEAQIAGGLLRSAGIPVHLHGANHVSANWMLGLAVGVRLQVPASFESDAREILAIEAPLEEPGDTCPRCGSAEVVAASASRKASLVLTHMLQLPWPFRRDRLRCRSCAHTWAQGSDN